MVEDNQFQIEQRQKEGGKAKESDGGGQRN